MSVAVHSFYENVIEDKFDLKYKAKCLWQFIFSITMSLKIDLMLSKNLNDNGSSNSFYNNIIKDRFDVKNKLKCLWQFKHFL